MQTEESSVIEEIDCGLVLDAVNKVLMRRAYFREKQRSHRRRERDDIHQLRKQAEELETQAQRLRLRVNPRRMQSRQPPEDSDGGLSWHAIAAMFRHETRLTLAENADLVKTLRSHCSLLTRMQLWVAHNDKVPSTPPTSIRWEKVMLSDDPAIRKLTKEWATQQMYHNTAAAFQAFPTSFDSNEFSVCDLTVSDLWVNFVDYSQYVWHAPMEVAAYVLRYHLHELLSTRDMSSVNRHTVSLFKQRYNKHRWGYRWSGPRTRSLCKPSCRTATPPRWSSRTSTRPAGVSWSCGSSKAATSCATTTEYLFGTASRWCGLTCVGRTTGARSVG
ncbi:hypothetical protein, variant 2 [Aphanomyces astaci]|uniref:Uncharacterized protein n=1 Tax=Aphanomyces astaci TaxID=112090 RepID=W4GG68_APHAT|nr:hypothetical protein, variant 2 [Aphanomyces astaci]ETV78660.1 hypothetical protein, variant 2 [Aphanomyces astaci]|eukprot:XP_009831379.1 hypothetical protein, variant 2 [Aphanomyces astaci]